jgi:tetratricopeptide (TPR) repeat protein
MTRAVALLPSSLLAALLLAAPLLAASASDDAAAPSRWRHNARARTEVAIERQEQGELEPAGEAFDEALGLAPGDPLARFNAGTASLLRADERAVPLLEAAAEAATGALEPLAYYNLGNAHLAGQSFAAAIEAYKESLRLEPANRDAKHNLELAQRRLEQQQREQQQDEQQEDEEGQEQEQQPAEGEQQDPGEQPQEQQEQPGDPGDEQQERQRRPDSPLPDFEDQPDMTAEQAAAILEAVENLEREQRRKQAMEQLKRVKGDRDW